MQMELVFEIEVTLPNLKDVYSGSKCDKALDKWYAANAEVVASLRGTHEPYKSCKQLEGANGTFILREYKVN